MANDMTVEGLIELLQKEHSQALVLIERDHLHHPRFGGQVAQCNVLNPYRVQANPRNGRVYIVCDQHDC